MPCHPISYELCDVLTSALLHEHGVICNVLEAPTYDTYASYDVLVHQLAVLLAASFRPTLTAEPLPFASS